jgi:hypothetical protein
MKNILKNLFTSKKKKQQAIDASYVELDRILKLKKAEHEAAHAQNAKLVPSTKKAPVKKVTVTVTKTVEKPTAKKTTPKKK